MSVSLSLLLCVLFCWLPYPSSVLLFFYTYLVVFSLSFIFFSSSETELIKIIHMQAVYRSSFDAVDTDDADERRLGDFSHFPFPFPLSFFCSYFIWFHFNCFFSCIRCAALQQIFRFPLLLFSLTCCPSSSSSSSLLAIVCTGNSFDSPRAINFICTHDH